MSKPKRVRVEISTLYIRGWKHLARYLGYHPRTLQKWHLEKARLPFFKIGSQNPRSRWIITPDRVHVWLRSLGMPMKADANSKRSFGNR